MAMKCIIYRLLIFSKIKGILRLEQKFRRTQKVKLTCNRYQNAWNSGQQYAYGSSFRLPTIRRRPRSCRISKALYWDQIKSKR